MENEKTVTTLNLLEAGHALLRETLDARIIKPSRQDMATWINFDISLNQVIGLMRAEEKRLESNTAE